VDVPERALDLLADLHQRVRLPILLALQEHGPLSTHDLLELFEGVEPLRRFDFQAVNYGVKRLIAAGFVEHARTDVVETSRGSTARRVYSLRGNQDWRRLVDVLVEYGAFDDEARGAG
jgi:hypothetical protein